jgi:alpha-galactosidase
MAAKITNIKNIQRLFVFVFIFFSAPLYAQKYQGLALTPPMGWNSWNTFQTKIKDQLTRGIADKLVSSGMKDAGYSNLILDDGWMAMERDSVKGNLVPDPKKFPGGMKILVA